MEGPTTLATQLKRLAGHLIAEGENLLVGGIYILQTANLNVEDRMNLLEHTNPVAPDQDSLHLAVLLDDLDDDVDVGGKLRNLKLRQD